MKKFTIKAALTSILLLTSGVIFGQNTIISSFSSDTVEWSQGNVALNSGKKLEGLVRYDSKNGIVTLNDGTNSKPFTSRNLSGFEFVDPFTTKLRSFHSIPFEDPKTSIVRPLFFELIRDFGDFAVVAKTDPINIDKNVDYVTTSVLGSNNNQEAFGKTFTKIDISQTETIYFLGTDGKIEEFLKVTIVVVDRVLYDRKKKTKQKILDKKLPSKYFTSEGYEAMQQFAEDNDMEFKIKDDFIKLLDYYQEWKKKH